ncbi:MAG: hypothetical protein ACP5M7_09940 [Thermoproteota archaeon]
MKKNKNFLSLRQLHKVIVEKYKINFSFDTFRRYVKEGIITPDFVIAPKGKVTRYYFSVESVDRIASAFIKTFENKNKEEINQTDPNKFDFVEYFQKLSSNS